MIKLKAHPFSPQCSGGGTGGREPGRIRAGGVREAGGERAGSGIPKVAGTREKRRKISQYCVTFCRRHRARRRELLRKGAGSGSKRYGRREFQTPLSPPTM